MRSLHSSNTRSAGWPTRCLLIVALCTLSTFAVASEAEEQYAEGIVRAVYYEGIPYDTAAGISDAGAARLTRMLDDPQERPHYANILICLGIVSHEDSYETLIGFLGRLREEEVTRLEFRAWRIVPVAMGHLARKDARALRWLLAQLTSPTREDWSFHGFDLDDLRRRGAILGLGVSGLPEAAIALRDYARGGVARSTIPRSDSGPGLDREIDVALDLNAQVAAFGPGSLGARGGER